jgi:hypothetical protein
MNEGRRNIHLLDVQVNDAVPPGPVFLGISYDTGTLVSMSPEQDPRIEFMNIHDHPIAPRLSSAEIQNALEQRKHTAIHYGIRIVNNDKTPIHKVTIRYRYLGITRTLTVTKWFES